LGRTRRLTMNLVPGQDIPGLVPFEEGCP